MSKINVLCICKKFFFVSLQIIFKEKDLMKNIVLCFFALLVFFAGVGVTVVHYGCDACREHSSVMLGLACADIHTPDINQTSCCGTSCDTAEHDTNSSADNHEDCTSERLSIPLDSYVAKVQLNKSLIILPAFLLSMMEYLPVATQQINVSPSFTDTSFQSLFYEDYLSKISVFII